MSKLKGKIKYGSWETKYTGIIFDIKQRQVIYPDGSQKTFEHIFRADSVSVLAFDDKNRLLLTYEHRDDLGKYVHFLPAGRMDKPGESFLRAAKRELREETGYEAKTWKMVRNGFNVRNIVSKTYCYAAKDLKWNPLGGDEYYPIKLRPVSLKKAVQMCLEGQIPNEFLAYNILYFNNLVKTGQWKW